ncbi:MAG TPA: holo-[acyl-carrier-protein] synthase [Caldilineae bacterium]|nr:holo-[acyl-carrier-protein] synthase [Caldilineae bacterium]
MLAVGVDIVELDRIAAMVERWGDRFLRRVYTPAELAYCSGRTPSLAVRWAAKEAVSKVLACDWMEVGWKEIEVARLDIGQPRLVLHGRARARAETLGFSQWAISLSHSRDYAVAVVVAMAGG